MSQTERLPGLDLLRLCAALSVVAFHWLYRGSAPGGPMDTHFSGQSWAEFGYLGVNLFFLISGYVISRSAEGRDVGTFFVARFARLYPGHLACMTLTFLVLWIAADPKLPVSLPQWVANLTMFAPALGQPFMDGVYWSIVLEIIFYGWVTIAIALGIFDRHAPRIAIGWLAVCAVNEFWIGSTALRILFVTEYGPLFVFGMMLRHWREKKPGSEIALIMLAAFLLSCNTLSVTQGWMAQHYGRAPSYEALLLANLLLHAALMLALRAGRFLPAPSFWTAAGALTYPIYLLHQNVGYVLIDGLAPLTGKWPALAMAAVAILLVSLGLWKLVEQPGSRAIKRIARTFLPQPSMLERNRQITVPSRS